VAVPVLERRGGHRLGDGAVGLTSYFAGQAAASAIQRYGLYAGAAIVVGVIVGWLGVRYARRRVEQGH